MLNSKELIIDPIDEKQIQPASVDIRLDRTFCILNLKKDTRIHLDRIPKYHNVEKDEFVLQPGQFILGSTIEYIKLPNNLTAFVEGRSSMGRLGLFIQNAGWVDPGFEGNITLELFNASQYAIVLTYGRRIGQLVFAKMDKDAENPYRGKYQKQIGATGSYMYQDNF